MAERERQDNPL